MHLIIPRVHLQWTLKSHHEEGSIKESTVQQPPGTPTGEAHYHPIDLTPHHPHSTERGVRDTVQTDRGVTLPLEGHQLTPTPAAGAEETSLLIQEENKGIVETAILEAGHR